MFDYLCDSIIIERREFWKKQDDVRCCIWIIDRLIRTERNHKKGLQSFNMLDYQDCTHKNGQSAIVSKSSLLFVIMLNCEWRRLVLIEEDSWEDVVGRDWSRFAKDTSCHYVWGCGVAQRASFRDTTLLNGRGDTPLTPHTDWLSAGGPRGDHLPNPNLIKYRFFNNCKFCFIERAKPVQVSTSSVQS